MSRMAMNRSEETERTPLIGEQEAALDERVHGHETKPCISPLRGLAIASFVFALIFLQGAFV